MRVGDLVVIRTGGLSEVDGTLAVVVGDLSFVEGLIYRRVLCTDMQVRHYFDSSLSLLE